MTDPLALFAPPDAEHAAEELIELARLVRAATNTYAHELDRAGSRALLDGARALTYLAERAADRAARLPMEAGPPAYDPNCVRCRYSRPGALVAHDHEDQRR